MLKLFDCLINIFSSVTPNIKRIRVPTPNIWEQGFVVVTPNIILEEVD